MSDVFISYSRKDSEFAKKLTNALKRTDRDVWIDWEDIPRGADWLQEIFAGIEAADAFVFIVSQHSLTSEICNDELAYARKHKKRIVPLIRQEIKGEAERFVKSEWFDATWQKIAQENWADIGHLNWLFFDTDEKFESEFAALIETIETDLVHVKLHTRFLVRARDWETGGNNPSFLLTGDEIDSAETWLAESGEKSPEPTQLQREYISASRGRDLAEKRRLRNLRNTSIVAGIVGVIAILSTIMTSFSAINASKIIAVAEAGSTQLAQDMELFVLQQQHVSTLASGGVIIPPMSDMNPTMYIATLTQVAVLNEAEPIEKIDEFGVAMVHVPEGCFWMGSIFQPDEQPVNEVCFDSSFWIDRYEVTNDQFDRLGGVAEYESTWSEPMKPRSDITWFEAQYFCSLRNARLPTEAEWEYAARGPDSLVYPWGNEFITENVAYHNTETTADVGETHRPNGMSWIGVYDMSGNVWEWTNSFALPYPYYLDEREDISVDANTQSLIDASIPRVLRGGAFDDVPLEYPVRAAYRGRVNPNIRSRTGGFRCVREEYDNDTMTLTSDLPLTSNSVESLVPRSLATTQPLKTYDTSANVISVGVANNDGCSALIEVQLRDAEVLQGSVCVWNAGYTNSYGDCGDNNNIFFEGTTVVTVHLGGVGEFKLHTIFVNIGNETLTISNVQCTEN